MSLVIGLHGPNGSGKTTVARRLVEMWGFERVGTGDAIKEEALRHFRATLKADLWSRRGQEPTEEEVRAAVWIEKTPVSLALLQDLGMYRRRDEPDFWVKAWQARAEGPPRVVDDNLRFPNEAEAVRHMGGWLVKIHRPGIIGGHETEHALADWEGYDWTIENDGDLDDLIAEADRLAMAFLANREVP